MSGGKMSFEEYKENMYSAQAGSHGIPGNRCCGNSLAGILSYAEWGLFGPNATEEDKEIAANIVKLLEVLETVGMEAGIDYAINQMAYQTSVYHYVKEEEE